MKLSISALNVGKAMDTHPKIRKKISSNAQ